MFDLDSWKEILATIKSNKKRTILTAFGVFWGIFMLAIMLGIGKGLQNIILKQMGDFATNSAFMWTSVTTKPYKGFDKGRYWNFRNSDTEAIKQNIEEIELIAPRVSARSSRISPTVYGNKSGAFSIFGDYPEWNDIDPVDMLQGRYINQLDINSYRKVAIIGKRVKETLFDKDEDPIDKFIRVNGVYFQVVGVFESKKGSGQAEEEEKNIHLPFTTMQRVFNYGDKVFWYALTSNREQSVAKVADKVMTLLKKRHNIHPDDERAIGHFNVEKIFQKVDGLFLGIATLIWIVGAGTLLSGAVGVSNIMLVVVKERTSEFGIRRAIGATPKQVIKQIIMESVVLTTIAGWAGLVSGVALLNLFDKFLQNADQKFMHNPMISFNIGIIALSILILSGIMAGLLPAYRAVKMKPIEALRTEK